LDEVLHIHQLITTWKQFQNFKIPGTQEHNIQRIENNTEKMTATSNTKWKHLRYKDCDMCITWWMQQQQMPLSNIVSLLLSF
jgi:hypothetical protein